MYVEAGEKTPVTKKTLTHGRPSTGVMCASPLPGAGGGVLTVAHALQEVFEGLSQLPWLRSEGEYALTGSLTCGKDGEPHPLNPGSHQQAA